MQMLSPPPQANKNPHMRVNICLRRAVESVRTYYLNIFK